MEDSVGGVECAEHCASHMGDSNMGASYMLGSGHEGTRRGNEGTRRGDEARGRGGGDVAEKAPG